MRRMWAEWECTLGAWNMKGLFSSITSAKQAGKAVSLSRLWQEDLDYRAAAFIAPEWRSSCGKRANPPSASWPGADTAMIRICNYNRGEIRPAIRVLFDTSFQRRRSSESREYPDLSLP